MVAAGIGTKYAACKRKYTRGQFAVFNPAKIVVRA
jgi:hypothetical protein